MVVAVAVVVIDTSLEAGASCSSERVELGIIFRMPFLPPPEINLEIGGEALVISWATEWSVAVWMILVAEFMDLILLLIHVFKVKNLRLAGVVLVSGMVVFILLLAVKIAMFFYLRSYFSQIKSGFTTGDN